MLIILKMEKLISNLFTDHSLGDSGRARSLIMDAVRHTGDSHMNGYKFIMIEAFHLPLTLNIVYKTGVACDPSSSNFPSNVNVLS